METPLCIRVKEHIGGKQNSKKIHHRRCGIENHNGANFDVYIENIGQEIEGLEQYAFRAFADALEAIPTALAENSGLAPIDSLTDLKAKQIQMGIPYLGIDAMFNGTNDMKQQKVVETLASRRNKYRWLPRYQVVRMILKIDDVRIPNDEQQIAN
ncbi:hypothetical protein DICVIV_05706 [Dictyocaulus viviparus]|uniref:Uncharacterized protein n=1 Tax=Dictyocaulus viviparus TaxID=29172 RepID=A0A0D8XUB5_DICVI|nr:hypothetical protein DICVIV_05706 [Dictyocaulus viviparus]